MKKRINAEHSIVYSKGDDVIFGYFGWPTVCTFGNKLIAGASGFRTQHVCPYGQTVLFESTNGGRTWGEPYVVNNSPIDDRDVGLLDLGNGELLITWFSQDTRKLLDPRETRIKLASRKQKFDVTPILDTWDDKVVADNVGSYVRIRDAEGKWGKRIPVPVSSPHGPTKLNDGRILYVGGINSDNASIKQINDFNQVKAIISDDNGRSWQHLSDLPPAPNGGRFCEPHAIQLPNGRIIAHLRHEPEFSIYQCVSDDGGKTWSDPEYIIKGAPPHLMRHSSGILICSFGYRAYGYGQRVLFSRDNGESYEEWILRDDGFGTDLGYPSTVELPDGSLFTLYYQRPKPNMKNNSILASHWELPDL